MKNLRARPAAIIVLCALLFVTVTAFAALKFPPLSGRVVDEANLLSPATERELTQKLQTLETANSRQLVIVTVASLQGYEIEDYGYQLGRAWGVGQAKLNNGALFIIAPNERRVRIEVGYGLEPILTDAFSSLVIQNAVLPHFRDGNMQAGVIAGANALIEQLSLDVTTAEQRAAAAKKTLAQSDGESLNSIFPVVIFILFILLNIFRRTRRRGVLSALPFIFYGGGGSRGGGFGGGHFGGGGGGFGGGGASGRW